MKPQLTLLAHPLYRVYHALHNGRGAYKQGGLSAAQDPPSLESRFAHEHLPADREKKPKKFNLDFAFQAF